MRQLIFTWIKRIIWLGMVFGWPLQVNSRPLLDVQSATNSDGSAVRIKTLTDKQRDQRHIQIYFRKHNSGQMKLVASMSRSMSESGAAGLTYILDWDRNGTHEISLIESCSPGPNCEGVLYRIGPIGELVEMYEGSAVSYRYINGYFIDYTRNNCCSWIATAHPVSPDHLHIEAKPAFYVFIGYEPTSLNSAPQYKCRFYRHGPSGEELPINISKKKFMNICNFYKQHE